MDLAVKSTLVEEALNKGERVCAANASRSPAAGENIICVCLYFVYLCMHANGGHISNGLPFSLSTTDRIVLVLLLTNLFPSLPFVTDTFLSL